MILRTTLIFLLIGATTITADDSEERVLFNFDNAESAKQWQIVNDSVFVGESDGHFRMTDDKSMEFYGTLSLEKAGGHTSVLSKTGKMNLRKGDSIAFRVRGDGREYSLNLHVPPQRVDLSLTYRNYFQTRKDQWLEVRIPLHTIQATEFGRAVLNQPLDPSKVNSLSFLLNDKKAGPFKLEVDWIKISTGSLSAESMIVHRDIPYAETKNERQTLDVFAPTEGKDHPIVFWIHGGGWQAGSKEVVQKKPQAFVDKGFVFVSTNYRLLPDATIKQMGEDVSKAIRWIHDHAKDYGGDPNTFFVMGHSAGAQLAALVCTDDRYLKADGLSFSIIKGCVPVDGDTYDVPMQIATVSERIANIYRRKFGDEESQKDLSPVTHVATDKNIPPFLILHVADHPETKGQSQRLAKALQEAGVAARAYPAEGKNHGTINSELGLQDDKPTKVLFEFVDGVLKEKGHAEKIDEN